MRRLMWRREGLKAGSSTGWKWVVIIRNLHITVTSQDQTLREGLPIAAKPGLVEGKGGRGRRTNRGERDRHDLRELPGTQARRGHTNDLPPLIVSFKSEDLSHEGVVARPPTITYCQRVRARNPMEKWRI